MKHKFEIKRVNIGVDGNNHDFLQSFDCKGADGKVIRIDPMVSGEFPETDDMAQDEMLDWARGQVGKTLFADGLHACEYITFGKTYIV